MTTLRHVLARVLNPLILSCPCSQLGSRLVAAAVVPFITVGCASPVLIKAQRVERIPPGTYTVLAARGAAGSPDYSAVLFQMPGAELALAMPGVEQRAHTNTAPEMYLNGHAAGFAAYELRDATNQVRGYLLAPTGGSVMIGDRAAKKDRVIIVNTLGGSPEGRGGGSGSGSGSGSGM